MLLCLPKCIMMGGDSIPHDVDPDIDRSVMPIIRLQQLLPILIKTSLKNNVYPKQGVPFRIHAEHKAEKKKLKALQNISFFASCQ